MKRSFSPDWDWLSAVLLFLLLQVTAGRLIIANWAPFLYFASVLCALGTFLGLALGNSRFKRAVVTWLAIDYTFMVIPWQWTAAVQSDVPLSFRDQLHMLASRLAIASGQFIQRAPVNDSFFFVAFIALTMWIIGLTSGYWLTRHDNLLAAVIPSGLVMMIIQVYDDYFTLRSWWLATYLFLLLILVGRRYFLRSRIEWRRQHIAVSEDAWPDILNGLAVTALSIVFIAWILPTSLSSLQAASDAWNSISNPIRNRLSNAVVSLQSPYSNGGADFYSDNLTLGLHAAQGNQPVFTVKVISAPTSTTPYYWRGHVYDFYSNGGWSNTGASTLDFQPAGQTLNLANAPDRVESQFQITMQLPQQSLLYAPSEPVWVNQPGNVMVTSASGGENDPLAWFANPPIPQGADYQVRAAIADPSVANLEAAGTNYPSWVVNRYLEVPQNIEPAIQTLAVQIARGKNTPYDQAEAITNYLRNTIQYSVTVQPPPPGVDPAVWVLFDTKKGFCNYYASDEVLMLRSIGIPARMAVGFAEGESSGNSFTVLNHDAHAWPEVYFPGIGWIEFEPTVIQNPIVRPAGKSQIANESNNNASSNANSHKPKENSSSESNSASKPLAFNSLLNNILLISFLLLVIGLMIFAFRRYRFLNQMPVYLSNGLGRIGVSTPSWINAWVNWNQMTAAEHSFASINWSLRWLGSPQPIYATAAERAAALTQLLPSAKEYIETVASEHQSALFTKRSPDLVRARRAGLIIILLTLRYKFLRFWSAISGADVYSG